MNTAEWLAIIAVIPATVASITAVFISKANQNKIGEVHVLVNSKMSDALARAQQLVDLLNEKEITVPKPPDTP